MSANHKVYKLKQTKVTGGKSYEIDGIFCHKNSEKRSRLKLTQFASCFMSNQTEYGCTNNFLFHSRTNLNLWSVPEKKAKRKFSRDNNIPSSFYREARIYLWVSVIKSRVAALGRRNYVWSGKLCAAVSLCLLTELVVYWNQGNALMFLVVYCVLECYECI